MKEQVLIIGLGQFGMSLARTLNEKGFQVIAVDMDQKLVNEAAKQIDLFKAQPQQIKENVEKLIEKNIIKRNGPSYEYIA